MGSILRGSCCCLFFVLVVLSPVYFADAAYHFVDYRGALPIHVYGARSASPVGMTPDIIKSAYHLPSSGGSGTIAIVGAYDSPAIESDLAVFNSAFRLRPCTKRNGCLTIHRMSRRMRKDSNWEMEASLDVEWAHAIAPDAKILLVESTTPSGYNLLRAAWYAAKQRGVVAVSMSWGGPEFPEEASLDRYFINKSGVAFVAASGDDGAGVSWPASSPYVIGVGGTSLYGTREVAWKGSGGGVSRYEREPDAQTVYAISQAYGMRAVPDVAYNADPRYGFAVYHAGAWRRVGGTSAGAPQWAAIASLSHEGGGSVNIDRLYKDKIQGGAAYFRDITRGKNGDCGTICKARRDYNFVTGLGTPQTAVF